MTSIYSKLAMVAVTGILAVSAMSAAQTVGNDDTLPAANLNLPSTFTTFGKVDPFLRKPTAIVNGDVITGTDVDQRLALIVLANGGKITDEERDRLRVQVLRNLIDESLQILQAKSNDISVPKDEVEQSFTRVSQNFKRTPQQMREYLRSQGSSERSIKRQIEGEMAWSRLLRRKVEPFVNISDEEVKSIMERLTASKGTQEYHVGEIFMYATPENAADIAANMRRIMEDLGKGRSFPAYARQFSEATTAAVGGDLGWIRPEQLPDSLAEVVKTIPIGQVAGPIQVPGGFSILSLVDTRQVLVADPRDALLSLRQMAITLPPTMTNADAKTRVDNFTTATQSMQGCGQAEAIAKLISAEIVDNDRVRIRDLPPALQDLLMKLQVGQSTPPFGSKEEGIRVLTICGRDDPETASGPSADAIEGQLRDERINRRAQILLRDLRRDAIIDYR